MKKEESLSYYLKNAKVINANSSHKKIRIGLLGSFTINGLEETLRVKCNERNINCITFVGNYNQYNQEILKKDSNFYQFKPELTFLILDVRHVLGELFFRPYSIPLVERKEFVKEKIKELGKLISSITENSNSKIVITELQIPTYSPYGINDNKENYGITQIVHEINYGIKKFIMNESSSYVYDFNKFIMRYGENNVFSFKQFFSGDIKISTEFIPKFVDDLMGFIISIFSLTKKCIVLDLDNTLWGGIVGEDGFDKIRLGDDPIGRSFVEFQKRLLALNERGIILAINSKNNANDAMKVIHDHPNMVLRENNFASIVINWKDKVSNMKSISDELSLGLDSFVFFDDDPINREFVEKELPQVMVIDLPKDPSEFGNIITKLNEFQAQTITEEDVNRNQMYLGQRKRKELEADVGNFDEFLKEMNVQIEMNNADNFSIPRISQLILKTNQFNLTTKRYQEEEISSFVNDDKKEIVYAKVSDKFGDNGITGVYIIDKQENEWLIDTFLLSCRIIGRGIEDSMLCDIIEKARKSDIKKIKAKFIPTQKNAPTTDFLPNFGFTKDGEFWTFMTEEKIQYPSHIKRIKNE